VFAAAKLNIKHKKGLVVITRYNLNKDLRESQNYNKLTVRQRLGKTLARRDTKKIAALSKQKSK